MPFSAAPYFFTHLNGSARYVTSRRAAGEGQKPPTCPDKAWDSCDDYDSDKEEEEETELILELRLEVKDGRVFSPYYGVVTLCNFK